MALRLINVASGGGNAGTAASVAGADLFNKAMNKITEGVGGVVDSENKQFRNASADTTQKLVQGLDTATTDTASQLRMATEKALKDPLLTRQDRSTLLGKLNTLDADIGKRETAAITLANTRERQQDEALLKGIDRSGFAIETGGNLTDFNNKITSIDKAIAKIQDPDRRAAARQTLLSQAGLSKTEFGNRVLNEMPTNKDGTVDQTAFAKQLRAGIGKDMKYSDAEISGLIKGREDLAGITTAKAVAAQKEMERFKSRLRTQEASDKMKGEPRKDKEVRENLSKLNVGAIGEGWISTGKDIKDQFLTIQLDAFRAGMDYDEIELLTSQHGKANTLLGFSPEGDVAAFREAINAALLEKLKAQTIQR